MGQTAATIIASGLCCCFNCCCQQCSEALKRLLGPQRVTKIFYVFLIFSYTVPSIFVFFLIHNWKDFLTYFNQFISCPNQSGFECIGASSVYRLSFSLLVLFAMMFLLMLCRNKLAMVFNEGLFFFKYCFVVTLFIALLWVSNDVFTAYATASQYISIIFMVIQSIILIDLFYLAGIKLVKRYSDGETYCAGILIFLSLIFEAGAFTMNILGYIYSISVFTAPQYCGSTLWVNVITSLILLFLPSIQLFNWNVQNSLLTTALVSMYVSYLTFIAQFSYSDGSLGQSCKARMSTPILIGDVIVSTTFFVLTLYGNIMGGTGQVKVTRNGDINKAVGVAPKQPQRVNENDMQEPSLARNQGFGDQNDEITNYTKYTSTCVWPLFHFHMCLASIYVGMLITNWKSASLITGNLESDGFGFWVRVAIAWATTLLYLWTLVVPKIFPERDFRVQ